MTIRAQPIREAKSAGDKGAGLIELADAGLSVPPTVVVLDETDVSPSQVLNGSAEVGAYLGVGADEMMFIRPSLTIARRDAPAVSGLYPSREATVASLEGVIREMRSADFRRDREIELTVLGGDEPRSNGIELLVQPRLRPEWSGVAHVKAGEAGVVVECGIVEGHLSRLVDGKVVGWECRLSGVRLSDRLDVAAVAEETALTQILRLDGARNVLDELFTASGYLCASVSGDREVEWAVVGGELWFLQSQPLERTR